MLTFNSVSAAQLRGDKLPATRTHSVRKAGRVAVSAQASPRQGAEPNKQNSGALLHNMRRCRARWRLYGVKFLQLCCSRVDSHVLRVTALKTRFAEAHVRARCFVTKRAVTRIFAGAEHHVHISSQTAWHHLRQSQLERPRPWVSVAHLRSLTCPSSSLTRRYGECRRDALRFTWHGA